MGSGLIDEYPKWKHMAPENPTSKEFDEAWANIFGNEGWRIIEIVDDGSNQGFKLVNEGGRYGQHGGFSNHTEEPVIHNGQSIIYEGFGCPWDADRNGRRYHKIDSETGLPYKLEYALALETVRSYWDLDEVFRKKRAEEILKPKGILRLFSSLFKPRRKVGSLMSI